jgi:hypothetical protein
MAIVLDGTAGITTPDLTDTSLTSGRVVYAGTSGNLTGVSGFTFNGTTLGVQATSFTPSSSASSVLIEDKSTWSQGLQFYLNNAGTYFSSRPSGAVGAANSGGLMLTAGALLTNDPSSSNGFTATTSTASVYNPVGGTHIWYGNTGLTAGNTFTATERARISSDGNLLVGTTSNSTYPSRIYALGTSAYGGLSAGAPGSGSGYPVYFLDSDATSASQQMVHFDRGSSTVGYITTTNTTTTYSSVSDYRLKNTITPITGALAKVALLKPCTYKWNKDGSVGEGFIAHELQEVCPIAVHGTKDGIDADGKPDYQGVDTSFLVATLTAAIQEQQALITTLTERITALEGA